jgi:hypothetical protein
VNVLSPSPEYSRSGPVIRQRMSKLSGSGSMMMVATVGAIGLKTSSSLQLVAMKQNPTVRVDSR